MGVCHKGGVSPRNEFADNGTCQSGFVDGKPKNLPAGRTRRPRPVNPWRLVIAFAVDVLHVFVGFYLCFGWLEPRSWRTHVLSVAATLSGWAGFGTCPMSALSSRLRGRTKPRFDHLVSLRTWICSWLRPVLGDEQMTGECDLAGVVVLFLSTSLSLARADVPEVGYFVALSVSGFLLTKGCGYK